MSSDQRIVEPGSLDVPAGTISFLRLPRRDLFAMRAERFRQLSAGHPLEEYLSFLALLADAQQDALERLPPSPYSCYGGEAQRRGWGTLYPVSALMPLERIWQEGLAIILGRLQEATLPAAARETVDVLLHVADGTLEVAAELVLAGNLAAIPPQHLPFIAGALQVYWVQLAMYLGEGGIERPQEMGRCPLCGSFPVAGMVRSNGAERGLRYLSCSLCAAQWHLERVKCSNCASTRQLDYYTVEGAGGAIKAESCNDCNCYLKLFYLEKDNSMEAMADDLATLRLDMLMADKGKERKGLNLYFHPGSV